MLTDKHDIGTGARIRDRVKSVRFQTETLPFISELPPVFSAPVDDLRPDRASHRHENPSDNRCGHLPVNPGGGGPLQDIILPVSAEEGNRDPAKPEQRQQNDLHVEMLEPSDHGFLDPPDAPVLPILPFLDLFETEGDVGVVSPSLVLGASQGECSLVSWERPAWRPHSIAGLLIDIRHKPHGAR